MEDKIKEETRRLENRFEWQMETLDSCVADFKRSVAQHDARHIITFDKSGIEQIEKQLHQLEILAEQKSMLEYLLKEEEK